MIRLYRRLDKLIDEPAKGRTMERILRNSGLTFQALYAYRASTPVRDASKGCLPFPVQLVDKSGGPAYLFYWT